MNSNVIAFYSDASEWGGHEILSAQIAKILSQNGWNVHFIHFRPEFPTAFGPLVHAHAITGHSHSPFPILQDRIRFRTGDLEAVLRSIKPGKLVVCQGNIERCTPAISLCQRLNIPVISYLPMAFTQEESQAVLGFLRDKLALRIYSQISAWITISPYQEALLRRFISPSTPVALIPIPLVSGEWASPTLLENPCNILVPGRIYYGQKRQDILPKVAQLLSSHGFPFQMTVIGDGPHSVPFRHLVTSSGMESKIKVIPHVPQGELLQLFEQPSTLVLIPSRFEGGPTVFFEALQKGCPILIADEPYTLDYSLPLWMRYTGNEPAHCAEKIMAYSSSYNMLDYQSAQLRILADHTPLVFESSILSAFRKMAPL